MHNWCRENPWLCDAQIQFSYVVHVFHPIAIIDYAVFGDCFENQSYSMPYLLTPCNLLIRISTKTILLPFSISLQTEDTLSICTTKCTNFGFRNQSPTQTGNRLFKMHTYGRFRPCHKAFNIAKTKKSFLKNVTMKCFMVQI